MKAQGNRRSRFGGRSRESHAQEPERQGDRPDAPRGLDRGRGNARLRPRRRQKPLGARAPRRRAPRRHAPRRQGVHPHARGRARSVLFRPESRARRHYRGEARRAACTYPAGCFRQRLRKAERRPRRSLARRRSGHVFRVSRPGRRRHLDPRRDLPARHAIHRCRRSSALCHDLSRLVSRPHAAHPLQGVSRRGELGHRPALFSRRSFGAHLCGRRALQRPQGEARHCQERRGLHLRGSGRRADFVGRDGGGEDPIAPRSSSASIVPVDPC